MIDYEQNIEKNSLVKTELLERKIGGKKLKQVQHIDQQSDL